MIPSPDILKPIRCGLAWLLWLSLVLEALSAPVPQTLTWTSPPTNAVLRLNQPYALSATASSGLPVTFRVVAGPAVMSGGTVVVTNAGTVILSTEQSGSDEWLPASELRWANPTGVVGTELSVFDTAGNASDVQVAGEVAYVADGIGGLVILNFSDPSNPYRLGVCRLPGEAVRVQVEGRLAYVAARSGGLQIVDVSKPTDPFLVGAFDTPGLSDGVHVVGSVAFLADWNPGLMILDITNPKALVRIGGSDTYGYALSVRVVDNLAYVADREAGLQVFDVSNPPNPVRLGGLIHPGHATDVEVLGSLAYVAASFGGLQIVDVSDPRAPTLKGALRTPGTANRVHVAGFTAYIAGGSAGLQAVDLTQLTAPRLSGGFDTPGYLQGLTLVEDLAFLADAQAGMRVVRLREGIAQQVSFALPGRIKLTEPVVDLSATANSGLPVSFTLVSGPGKVNGNVLTGIGAGTVIVRAKQPGNESILPAQTDATVIFERAEQSINFNGPSLVVLTDPKVTLSATANSGLPVTFRLRGGAATLNGDALTAAHAGWIELQLEQAGNDTFLPTQTTAWVFAYRGSQQLSFTPPLRLTLGDSPVTLMATSNTGLPVEVGLLSGPAILAGNVLTATNTGVVTVRARQAGDDVYEPAEAVREILVVSSAGVTGSLLDPSLQLDQRIAGQISSIVALPDGRIVIAGPDMNAGIGDARFYGGEVAGLTGTGTIDPDFPLWRGLELPWSRPGSMAGVVLRDHRELIATSQSFTGGGPTGGFGFASYLFRLSVDSNVWEPFGSISKLVGVYPQPDGGAIIAGGNRESIPGTVGSGSFLYLSRWAPDRSADLRFGLPTGMRPAAGGELSINFVRPLNDGSVIVAGGTLWPHSGNDYQANTAVFRLSPDGQLVWHYTLDSPLWLVPSTFVAEATGDRLVLFPSRELLAAKTGVRLGTFPIPPDVIARTVTYFQEPDGRLILSGTFTNYAGVPRRGLAAVFPDGSLDLSFDPGLGTTNAFTAIARQADGALLLAGPSGTFDGISHRGLIRLVRGNPNYVAPTQPIFHVQTTTPLFECGYPGEIHVVRTGLATQTNCVRVQTLAETAKAGADFVGVDTELVFLPGEGVKTVPLTVLRDDLPEETELFWVKTQFESGSTVLGPTNLPVQIGSVDCGVSFLTNAITMGEGAGYSSVLAFTIPYPPPGFTTRLRTRDLTAEAGRDYVAWEGSAVASPLVPIQISDNPWADGSRQYLVEAYDITSGETVTPGQSLTVTITDDDSLAGPYRGMAGNLRGFAAVRDGWLMVGDFPTVDGWPRPGLARFTLGGDLDHSFEPPAELAGQVVCAAGTPEGGVLLGGSFARLGTWRADGLVRLNAAGQLDAAFEFRPPFGETNCPASTNQLKAILVEPDGSSFVAGNFPAFFGCDMSPRLLRVSPAGKVEASWLIPGHPPASNFTLTGNGNGRRVLQGNVGVFAVEATGLTRLDEVDLGVGAPLAVLPDGGLIGLSGNTLMQHGPEGTLRAEVTQFRAEEEVWSGWQLHSVAVRADGHLLLSGVFQSTTRPGALRVLTLGLDPAALATGQVAAGEEVSLLRALAMIAHPEGPIAALNMLSYGQAEPKWWRLDATGRPVSDLAFSREVLDVDGRFHLALRGQAPEGYSVDFSDDLGNWTEWFKSPEVNWGQTFMTPPLPPELSGRYFRLKF